MAEAIRTASPGETLGARVRAARRARGLSQARLAGEELTKGFISQLEGDLVRPSIRSLQVIANRLGKSLDYFIGDEPLSTQKRLEFLHLAAQAAAERRAFDELLRIAEDGLRLELTKLERARFVRWLAHARFGLGDNEGALTAAEEALVSLDSASDPATVGWTMLIEGSAYLNLGQFPVAVQIYERALALIESHEVLDARLRTRLLISVGTAYRRLNRTTKAVRAYESALSLANRIADLRSLAQAYMGVAVTLFDSGELDGAIANYRRSLELFQQISDQDNELGLLQALATMHSEQGKYVEAEAYARQCRERAVAVGDERWAAVAEGELAYVSLGRGDARGAIELACEADRTLARLGDTLARPWALRTIAAAHAALGDHHASDEMYEQAIQLATRAGTLPQVSRFAVEFAHKLRERGEYERALDYLELARRHASGA